MCRFQCPRQDRRMNTWSGIWTTDHFWDGKFQKYLDINENFVPFRCIKGFLNCLHYKILEEKLIITVENRCRTDWKLERMLAKTEKKNIILKRKKPVRIHNFYESGKMFVIMYWSPLLFAWILINLLNSIGIPDNIGLARKFYRFSLNFYIILFFSNIKLVFNNICSVAVGDLPSTLW